MTETQRDSDRPESGETAPPDTAGADLEEIADEPESDPSDAFGVLGNEVRMAALRALLAAEEDGDGALTFSELFDAVPVDESAGFAYHLRQLTDRFCRQTDDEDYVLTYAGREIARAIRAGTYTDSVDFAPVDLGDPCPFCGAAALAARGEDNYVSVGCRACDRRTLTLPFPPGGHRAHDPGRMLDAFDRHHRHRLSLLADGLCPECSAPTDAVVGYPAADHLPADRPRVQFDCERCGCRLRSPVTLAVLEHPAVVSFYHRHGVDVRDRPLWNVGEEWREQVVSEEPWCVRVSTRLDGETLSLFVAENVDVVEVRETAAAS